MNTSTDLALLHWGERLFYPANRRTANTAPHLRGTSSQRADVLRQRIAAMVQREAPQVMVKVTGGGRGMRPITAHLQYISKHGRLPMEDERGDAVQGREELGLLVDEWRWGGSLIAEQTERREAYNIMLSMPRGTDPSIVQRAARDFARAELAGHKYVMVLHDHQAHSHVHLSVRAESNHGRRLNPRKADLQRWRETFAEKLRGWGIDAEATRAATRGVRGRDELLWRRQARAQQRLQRDDPQRMKTAAPASHAIAQQAWARLQDVEWCSDRDYDLAEVPSGLEVLKGLQRGVEVEARVDHRLQPVDRDRLHHRLELLLRADGNPAHDAALGDQRQRAQVAIGPGHLADNADHALAADLTEGTRHRAQAARLYHMVDTRAVG